MVDSHTHLEFCEPPDAELVEAATEAGVTRLVTVGTNGETCRAALAAAEDFPQVYAAIGRHPSESTGFDDADLYELKALAAHPRCVAIGETGLDYFRDHAPREDQQRAFEAQIELARETGKPLVIHTRAAEDDTLATLARDAGGVKVILHCFTMAPRLDECLAHEDWWFSFAGNVTYPSAPELRAAALRIPAARLLVETDAPFLSPQPVRGKPNQPANVVHTARALALERRVGYEELERSVEAAAAEVFGVVSTRRRRELGQNFLVDRNILDVIERLAELDAADVVLEVGGGPGALSERLAARAAHVHVVELDPRLEPGLREVLAPLRNATLHMGDALELELRALDPAPTKLVANLPYGIAATLVLRTIEELPTLDTWLVMVQREVGERLAAKPGTREYGAPSVLAQLATEVRVLRQVARTVFRPVPNVDSVLVGLRRFAPAPDPEVRRLVHDAFAHRRKALAGSLALAPGAEPGIRDRARAALEELGHPADERAERLSPVEFSELAAILYR